MYPAEAGVNFFDHERFLRIVCSYIKTIFVRFRIVLKNHQKVIYNATNFEKLPFL